VLFSFVVKFANEGIHADDDLVTDLAHALERLVLRAGSCQSR
jgi:hypothetical protein